MERMVMVDSARPPFRCFSQFVTDENCLEYQSTISSMGLLATDLYQCFVGRGRHFCPALRLVQQNFSQSISTSTMFSVVASSSFTFFSSLRFMDNFKLISNYGRGNANRDFLSATVRHDAAPLILSHWNRDMNDCSRIQAIVRQRRV